MQWVYVGELQQVVRPRRTVPLSRGNWLEASTSRRNEKTPTEQTWPNNTVGVLKSPPPPPRFSENHHQTAEREEQALEITLEPEMAGGKRKTTDACKKITAHESGGDLDFPGK